MTTRNWDLLEKARQSISGKWGLAIGAFLVVTIIQAVIQSFARGESGSASALGSLLYLITMGPFYLGTSIFALAYVRRGEPRFEQIFEGFKDFKRALIAFLLTILYIILWSVLLIVPGIIAAISYAMTFYILADDPDIKASDALSKSKQMMKGYKWKYFGLQMIFLLGIILCLLTLGIGFLWFAPWMKVTTAHFYEEIKDNPAVETVAV